jgi:hypothetical protein
VPAVAVRVVVRNEAVDVEVRGIGAHLMHLSGDLHVPMADVLEARVVGWDEARSGMGWRTGGGYWPGWFATGWYAVPGRKGARQFFSVFRDRARLLLVDTRLERPARLVLAVPDPDAMAADIERRRAGGGTDAPR